MTCPGPFLPQVAGKIFIHVTYFQGNLTAIIKLQEYRKNMWLAASWMGITYMCNISFYFFLSRLVIPVEAFLCKIINHWSLSLSLSLSLLLCFCLWLLLLIYWNWVEANTAKKAKWLSGEALQIAVKRREVKSKAEKERYKHLNADFQRIARRDKSLPQWSMQRNRGRQQNGKD